MKSRVDLIIHPARMRIIQFVAGQKSVTVAQIAKALSDIPKATLYRQVRTLTENDILQVVGEEKIRGTYEQSYALNLQSINPTGDESNEDRQSLVYFMLASLMEDFRTYFEKEEVDPVEDKLFLTTNTLYLNDSQFDTFTQEMFAVVEKYLKAPAQPEGKARNITVVSSPMTPKEAAEG